MTLPTPDQVVEYFSELNIGIHRDVKPVSNTSFSTQWTRVKLSISNTILVCEAIDFLKELKKHKLTNLHMTYIDKTNALSIYFELDLRLAKMIKPTSHVTKTIKEIF